MTEPSRTISGAPVVAAPGKVFLVGEYAVLEGAPAVLAAVNRNASAQFLPGLEPASPVIAAAQREAIAALGDLAAALPPGAPLVHTESFSQAGRKLGLGSSAAATVAAVGAIFEVAGRPVAGHVDRVHAVADAAHRAAQGGVGSGADVAAAVHGGLLEVVRPGEGLPATRRLTPPRQPELVVLSTGQAASTTEMVAAVRAFATRTPPLYRWLMDELRAHAVHFGDELAAGNVAGVIEAAHGYGDLLKELGSLAGVPIVSAAVDEAARVARQLGGTAKVSGAGGGDIAIALLPNAETATRFVAQCPAGLSVLDVRIEPRGVHRRLPATAEPARGHGQGHQRS